MAKEIGEIGDGQRVQSGRLYPKIRTVQKENRVKYDTRVEEEEEVEAKAKHLTEAQTKRDVIDIRKSQNEIVRLPIENIQKNRKVPVKVHHEGNEGTDLEAKIRLAQIKNLKHQNSLNK